MTAETRHCRDNTQSSLRDRQSLAVVSLRRRRFGHVGKDAQGEARFWTKDERQVSLQQPGGLETAKSTMKYLGGDTFFKKWSMLHLPWSQLPVMKYDDYRKLFAVDQTSDISS